MMKDNLTIPKVMDLSTSSRSEYRKIFHTLNEQSNRPTHSNPTSSPDNKGKQDLKIYFDSLNNSVDDKDTILNAPSAPMDTSSHSIYAN